MCGIPKVRVGTMTSAGLPMQNPEIKERGPNLNFWVRTEPHAQGSACERNAVTTVKAARGSGRPQPTELSRPGAGLCVRSSSGHREPRLVSGHVTRKPS